MRKKIQTLVRPACYMVLDLLASGSNAIHAQNVLTGDWSASSTAGPRRRVHRPASGQCGDRPSIRPRYAPDVMARLVTRSQGARLSRTSSPRRASLCGFQIA